MREELTSPPAEQPPRPAGGSLWLAAFLICGGFIVFTLIALLGTLLLFNGLHRAGY
jgi:hypothetical protein